MSARVVQIMPTGISHDKLKPNNLIKHDKYIGRTKALQVMPIKRGDINKVKERIIHDSTKPVKLAHASSVNNNTQKTCMAEYSKEYQMQVELYNKFKQPDNKFVEVPQNVQIDARN